MTEYSLEELTEAYRAFTRFIEALQKRDDNAVLAATFPPSIDALEFDRDHIAQAWIESMNISDTELPRLGTLATARVLEDGLVGFACMEGPTETPTGFRVQTVEGKVFAHALAMIRDEGRWKVWGLPDHDQWANPVRRQPIPPDFEPGSPIH